MGLKKMELQEFASAVLRSGSFVGAMWMGGEKLCSDIVEPYHPDVAYMLLTSTTSVEGTCFVVVAGTKDMAFQNPVREAWQAVMNDPVSLLGVATGTVPAVEVT